jgi:2,3-bisphosphoglycerate-dependent phosphoglycerate mutase
MKGLGRFERVVRRNSKKEQAFDGTGRKALKIYLFRHGQTTYNRDKRFTGWRNSALTPLGKKQAAGIGRKLKGKRIEIAFQTHLSRSIDTMRAVLRYHPECFCVVKDDRMIERSYGKLQGRSHAAFIRQRGRKLFDAYHRAYDYPPPGGESIKMTEKRVRVFIADLIKFMRENKVNVAISAHGNSMRPFRKHFEKLSRKQMIALENPWDKYFEYSVRA